MQFSNRDARAIPAVPGRPLLVVTCEVCGAQTVARSPAADTVRGWLLPEPWPSHLPQWALVSARCPSCTRELPHTG